MRHYETLFVLKPTLTDEEREARFNFIKEVIEKNGGKIAGVEHFGVRKLAYPIDKFERGDYYVIYFEGLADTVKELERIYRINEDVIKFLNIKYETKKDIAAWEKMVQRANKATTQQ